MYPEEVRKDSVLIRGGVESKKEKEKEENGEQQSPQKSGGASVASLLVGINAWTSVTRTIVSRQDNTHSLSRKVTMAEISREKPEGERIEMEIDKDELERERERERVASREAVGQREGREREFFRVYVDVSIVRIGERALN